MTAGPTFSLDELKRIVRDFPRNVIIVHPSCAEQVRAGFAAAGLFIEVRAEEVCPPDTAYVIDMNELRSKLVPFPAP